MIRHFLSVGMIFISTTVHATDPNDALEKTQQLLMDANQRSAAISGDTKAQAADAQVKKLVGGDAVKEQKVYNISSDVFADVEAKTGGDPEKMQQLLEQAAKDPKKFYEGMSSEQKEQIRKLASEIESNNVSRP